MPRRASAGSSKREGQIVQPTWRGAWSDGNLQEKRLNDFFREIENTFYNEVKRGGKKCTVDLNSFSERHASLIEKRFKEAGWSTRIENNNLIINLL